MQSYKIISDYAKKKRQKSLRLCHFLNCSVSCLCRVVMTYLASAAGVASALTVLTRPRLTASVVMPTTLLTLNWR